MRRMTGQVQRCCRSATGMSAQDADLITIGSYPTSTSALGLERVVRLMSNFNMISLRPGPGRRAHDRARLSGTAPRGGPPG